MAPQRNNVVISLLLATLYRIQQLINNLGISLLIIDQDTLTLIDRKEIYIFFCVFAVGC